MLMQTTMDTQITQVNIKVTVEFLLASTNKKKMLSQGNLKKAFQLFDRV